MANKTNRLINVPPPIPSIVEHGIGSTQVCLRLILPVVC